MDLKIILIFFIIFGLALKANEIQLKSGWNLVGVDSTDSVAILSSNLDVLKAAGGGVGGGGDFRFDKAFSQYATGNMKLGQGYWILADSDTNLTYTISSQTQVSVELLEGWNLINTCIEINATDILSQYPNVIKASGGGVGGGGDFRYDKDFAQYAKGTTKVGQGYWFLADKAFSIRCDSTTARDEPYFKYSWHLESKDSALNQSGFSINENSDINITQAWKTTKGQGVKVAIIDDSYDVNHEDLKSNIFITYNIQNDNNDVSNKTTESSHGTMCAGFVASPLNNKGSVGSAPDAKLILINDIYSVEDDAGNIKAFEYAKKQGAKVISCSWGSSNVSQALVAELKSLYDANITVLFASGNYKSDLDANDSIYDESEVEWVIGVGASGEDNDVTEYSDYGKNIDILAPGGDTDTLGILGIHGIVDNSNSNTKGLVSKEYTFTNGTSFSCPIAAGVVALMYSINPKITPKQVRDILISTADKVGTSNGATYDTNGFDVTRMRAYGKINAAKAVKAAKDLI